MSSSIAIPRRKQPRASSGYSYGGSSAASSSSSSPYSNWAAPRGSMEAPSPTFAPSSSIPSPVSSSSSSPMPRSAMKQAERRPSLLSSSLSKSEYTVINVAAPDCPPRLITCVKASQGFDWNQDIFLPSYLDYDSADLERKPDPVQDIVLTDEEAAAMLPQ